MKIHIPMKRLIISGLALALGVTLATSKAVAVPYASGVTKSGNTVSFVLNQNADGLVVLRNGGNPVSPGTNAGPLSFDMTGYTSYQIIVTGSQAKVWTQDIPDGTDRNFYLPCGVSINKNPSSTNFGKLYVSESQGGTTGASRLTTNGIYMLRADGVALGYANGGVNWAAGGSSSSPLRSMIGPDNHLYVADLWNDLAYEFNDDMSVATQLIDAGNKTSLQWVHSIYVEGTQATGDRKIYLVDGNYSDTVSKGLIRYDLGANATAIGLGTGTQIIGPSYFGYYPYDVARDSAGNWYLNQYRATAGQAPAISKFDGSLELPINTPLWETDRTYTYTWGLDINERAGRVAVGQYAGGNVYIFDVATGAFVESFVAGSRPRELAYDAAGNLVTVDSAVERARFWSPGGFTVATTSFDGTQAAFTVTEIVLPFDVSVTASQPQALEGGDPGIITISRTGDTTPALAVRYTLGGTATNGVDYTTLATTAIIPAMQSSVDVNVRAKSDAIAEPTKTVILTLSTDPNYAVVQPSSATVYIVDTNKPLVSLRAFDAQMYERTNDYARFRLTRWGDTNADITVNVAYSGTATAGTDCDGPTTVNVPPGTVNQDFNVTPIHNGSVTGPKTVTATATSGAGYDVGTTNSASITIVDADLPPETVLWSDALTNDTSASWTVLFATTNDAPYDATIEWAYDYLGNLSIPSAPHSPPEETHGLRMTVNKGDATAASAALNFYPNGRSFSGNYALRFDMFLIQNSSAGTTEYALFGINHSGTKTNWFRNSTAPFTGVDPLGWNFDGVFYDVEVDGSALGDYVAYSAPTTASHNPTPLTAGRNASTLTGVFKSPPWTPGAGSGGAAANVYGSATPIWADVEISQINGVITWKINNTVIFAYTNTTAYTSGNIMLGYTDAYDSIGSSGGSVIYNNVRVISLAGPVITQFQTDATNAKIDFSANAADVVGQFVLQAASTVNGAYSDVPSTITSLGGGKFRSTKALSGSAQFYRIRRVF